jgi:hypothetical protein
LFRIESVDDLHAAIDDGSLEAVRQVRDLVEEWLRRNPGRGRR